MEHLKELRYLKELISIDSQNPGNNEREVCDYIAKKLKKIGFSKIKRIEYKKKRSNIIASYKDECEGFSLAFNGHLDTKPAKGRWRSNPLKSRIEGDKIYGLGSADMKGGIASAIGAIETFLEKNKKFDGNIIFQGVSDEENGSINGMRYLSENYPEDLMADFAIVLEPTQLNVSNNQVGNLWLNFEIRGKAGHAGEPEKSINAIDKSFLLKQTLQKNLSKIKDKNTPVRLNLGNISGGIHPGTVPDKCNFTVDIRIPPKHERNDYITDIIRTVKKFEAQHKIRIKVSAYRGGGLEPSSLDENNYYLKKLCDYAGKHRLLTLTGGTDASFLNSLGVDTVVFGPGSLEQAHKPDEYTSAKEVLNCSGILYNFMEDVLN